MGAQQSHVESGDRLHNLSRTALCTLITNTDAEPIRRYDKRYYIYDQKNRRIDTLGIVDKDGTMYIYRNDQLVKIIKDAEPVSTISIDMSKLVTLHLYHGKTYVSVYDLLSSDYAHKKSIEIPIEAERISRLTMVHDIIYAIDTDVEVIGVNALGESAHISLDGVDLLRFSNSGEIVGTYGDRIKIYTNSVTTQNVSSCTDFAISDDGNYIYYIAETESAKEIRYIDQTIGTDSVLWKNKKSAASKIVLLDANEYSSLLLNDLDLRSANGAKLSIQSLMVLGLWEKSKLVIRPIIHTSDGSVLTLPKSVIYDSDSSYDYLHISCGMAIIKVDNQVKAYDIGKMIPIIICDGLFRLLQTQLDALIKESASDISEVMKVVGYVEPFEYAKITILAADDRENIYDVRSNIMKFCTIADVLSQRIQDIRSSLIGGLVRNRTKTVPIYAITVNANMTIIGTKTFVLLEELLMGNVDYKTLIEKLGARTRLYDRYQSVLEVLDHFYDYTKYIMLNRFDVPTDSDIISIPGSFQKIRDRLALAMCYLCTCMVMEYYAREVDNLFGNDESDYELNTELTRNLTAQFEPIAPAINAFLRRLCMS